jgi:hypothetical protein
MRAVAQGGQSIKEGLQDAAELSQTDPSSAYQAVCPTTRRNLVKYLGPSFATKFLYFAGGGSEKHPSLILDRVVATALHNECGWASLSTRGAWPESTYSRYCTLAHRWAREATMRCKHTVAPDEIEKALFQLGKYSENA